MSAHTLLIVGHADPQRIRAMLPQDNGSDVRQVGPEGVYLARPNAPQVISLARTIASLEEAARTFHKPGSYGYQQQMAHAKRLRRQLVATTSIATLTREIAQQQKAA